MTKNDTKSFSKSAEILLYKKCVEFNLKKKFKLTSGKTSPVYCDCRKLISFPKERNILIKLALNKIKSLKNFDKINNIAGGESAGIPYASLISQKLNLPLSYVRKEKKKFGKTSQIEGIINSKDNVLLVEDLMTDGGSKIKFIDAINNIDAKVIAIFVIFNYGINQEFLEFKGKKIKIISLATWKDILDLMIKKKLRAKKEINELIKFLKSINVKNLRSFL